MRWSIVHFNFCQPCLTLISYLSFPHLISCSTNTHYHFHRNVSVITLATLSIHLIKYPRNPSHHSIDLPEIVPLLNDNIKLNSLLQQTESTALPQVSLPSRTSLFSPSPTFSTTTHFHPIDSLSLPFLALLPLFFCATASAAANDLRRLLLCPSVDLG